MDRPCVVVVTGFGPFNSHHINASWEAVLKLNFELENITLHKLQIPVCYDDVDRFILQIWNVIQPDFVLHAGVSDHTDRIIIETQAARDGYLKKDYIGQFLPTGCCQSSGEEVIKCSIDTQRICNIINQTGQILARTSMNAGRYLCEYIFYKSLCINPNRAMFVHVPRLNQPYSVNDLASGLAQIILLALQELNLLQ